MLSTDNIIPRIMCSIVFIALILNLLIPRIQSRTQQLKINYNEFVTEGRIHALPIAVIGVLIAASSIIIYIVEPNVGSQILTPIVLGVIILIQAAVVLAFPNTLFGRWKPQLYKEKLNWNAFRAFLGDLAQLKKYSTGDLNMWGSWLVYGTALGVGDKVAVAMKELNINIDVAPVAPVMRSHFHPIRVASPPGGGSGGGRGGSKGRGGRMGGGGGRGGGGGGRRGR
jgi:uncharacterized membrane protein